MIDPPPLGSGTRLDFMGPLSAARADRLAGFLAAAGPSTVVDYGCGWGELLLRVLERCPQARGTGVEVHGPDVARARRAAGERGLADRVTFVEGSATDHPVRADLVVSVGAYQAFGTVAEALRALGQLVNPGGRLLFGVEVWERQPLPAELANMWPGASADDCVDLATLVDQVVGAGFRPLRIETAGRGEWEEFESGLAEDAEEWLVANPDHPAADELAGTLDAQRGRYLRGARNVLGFAYLTLAPRRAARNPTE